MTPHPYAAVPGAPAPAFPAPARGTVPTPLAGTVPAPTGRRVAAHLVDAAVLLPGVLAVLGGALPLLAGAAGPRLGVRAALVLAGAVIGVVTLAVQAWSDAARGWTVGKRVQGLRTVSARTGAPVGHVGALVRGWSDLADGTVVIDARHAEPAPTATERPLPAARPEPTGPPPTPAAPPAAATAAGLLPEPRPAGPVPRSATLTVPTRVPLAARLQASPVPRVPVAPVVPVPRPPLADGPAGARTAAPAERPAGPWVEVVLLDGRTVTVAGHALVGRDPVERSGESPGTLVAVDDPDRSVSKTHLALGVDTSGAWVVDRRSTNGTVVTLPDGQQIFCVPEERVRLRVGATVGFGGHAFTVTELATGAGTGATATAVEPPTALTTPAVSPWAPAVPGGVDRVTGR
ncbi:RDD family protein [uncultured Cellulomonas sp.]|uniref:RDD family protein n=1 Tax=uncultured Cellulomonas sp. TaxID=189682 RepID=UPI0026160A9C|nr:RDD family protein [uncultured Cellulomonas sp.]